MQKKSAPNERFAGQYVDGVFRSSHNGMMSGLNCPKGTKLYDESVTPAIYYQPDDTQKGEMFDIINPDIAPEVIKNCYAVSNFGRVMNIRSGKIMKPDGAPSRYQRVSLPTHEKNKKYSIHRLVLGTFHPIENMDEYQVNHKNMVKTDNYTDKPMEDGTVETNLEWCTASENVQHARTNMSRLTFDKATELRKLHDSGMSYTLIQEQNPDLGYNTIKYACENKTFVDPDYKPVDFGTKVEFKGRKTGPKGLTPDDVKLIRRLYGTGEFTQVEIQEKFYPQITVGTVSNIITRKSYANIP